MTVTTIAQLTDVHLGPIVGLSPTYWNFKRGLGFANWAKNRRHAYSRHVLQLIADDIDRQHVDHIAVTGDLANLGLPLEIEAGLRWLESLGTPQRVSVIPGNHDIYSRRGASAVLNHWAAYMGGADREDAFPYVKHVGPIALIGLNSAVTTAPFVAHGRLGRGQRERLAQILDQQAALGRFRLVMIHHPPLPGQAAKLRALVDAGELSDTIKRHGAELVIHGHNHVEMFATLLTTTGAAYVVGAPSSSLGRAVGHEPLARYNLYRIARAGEKWALGIETRGLEAPGGPVIELRRHGYEFTASELSAALGV